MLPLIKKQSCILKVCLLHFMHMYNWTDHNMHRDVESIYRQGLKVKETGPKCCQMRYFSSKQLVFFLSISANEVKMRLVKRWNE